jgi:copper chaperone CopZ
MINSKMELNIAGITCEACIKLITRRIKKLNGVTEVIIKDYNGKTIIISSSKIGISEIADALSDMPYSVTK